MKFEELIKKYNIKLNEQQEAAVKSVNGPTLLLAVPGSGKTTVLITRLGYMVYCCNIDPSKILTITYTVAATKDMKSRFENLYGSEMASELEFRTINGICAKIILEYGKMINKKPFELETDEGNITRFLIDIYRKLFNEYPTDAEIKNIRTGISYAKNMMLSETEIEKYGEYIECENLLVFYKNYIKYMRKECKMDYDDQMIFAYKILKTSSKMLELYQKRFEYICVDEAQDTSKIQHMIIQLLASDNENLFMVGDEDQSIYGFRAAYPEALLNFEKVHPTGKVLVMEENFRSNANIVAMADSFIQKNTKRHKKTLKAARDASTQVKSISVSGRLAQYKYMTKVAKDTQKETAVIYRNNESAIPLVDLLDEKKIPYNIRKDDLSFFNCPIVNDIRNIINFAYDNKNTDLFMKIYYKISLYINKATAVMACQISKEKDIPILKAVMQMKIKEEWKKKKIEEIYQDLESLKYEKGNVAITSIYNSLGYKEYIKRAKIKGDNKIETLKILGIRHDNPKSLLNRLDYLSHLLKTKEYDKNSKVILTTVHSSKGLEYDTVYLIDVIDGIFPETVIEEKDIRTATEEEKDAYEEERRMFYVAITRAKNDLIIFSHNKSSFHKQLFNIATKNKTHTITGVKIPNSILKGELNPKAKVKIQPKEKTEEEIKEIMEKILKNKELCHIKYGKGEITSTNKDNIVVKFKDEEKTFNLRFLIVNNMYIL